MRDHQKALNGENSGGQCGRNLTMLRCEYGVCFNRFSTGHADSVISGLLT